MTPAQVRAATGKPAQVLHANKSAMEYNYGDAGQLEVDFDKVHGKMVVTEVTLAPDFRTLVTSKRVGIGSTKNAVMHAYPEAKFKNSIGQIWIDELGQARHQLSAQPLESCDPGQRVLELRLIPATREEAC